MLALSAGGRLGRHHNQYRVKGAEGTEGGELNQPNDFYSFVYKAGQRRRGKKRNTREQKEMTGRAALCMSDYTKQVSYIFHI